MGRLAGVIGVGLVAGAVISGLVIIYMAARDTELKKPEDPYQP